MLPLTGERQDVGNLILNAIEMAIFQTEDNKLELIIKDTEAKPEKAKLLYDEFVNEFARLHKRVEQGKFGASMEIALINKGPLTFNFKI